MQKSLQPLLIVLAFMTLLIVALSATYNYRKLTTVMDQAIKELKMNVYTETK